MSNDRANDVRSDFVKFSDIFLLQGNKLTTNNFYPQKLRLNYQNSVYVKQYRLPNAHKKKPKNMSTEYNSPVIIVSKKSTDGQKKYRMCIDL